MVKSIERNTVKLGYNELRGSRKRILLYTRFINYLTYRRLFDINIDNKCREIDNLTEFLETSENRIITDTARIIYENQIIP